MNEGRKEGMDSQQEFPFAKMQKPLQNPANKKTCGYELTNRKPKPTGQPPNPPNLNSRSNKPQTNQRWRSPTPVPPNSSEPSFLAEQIPTKIKDGGLPEFGNPKTSIQFTSLLILPQPPTTPQSTKFDSMHYVITLLRWFRKEWKYWMDGCPPPHERGGEVRSR